MNGQSREQWEARVSRLAADFPYPDTPDLVAAVSQRLQPARVSPIAVRTRRMAWLLILACLLIGALLAVPPVRAVVREFLQIGAVRIFLPAATPSPTPHEAPATDVPDAGRPTESPTRAPHERFQPSPRHLAGRSTLAEAQARLDFPIRLPTYPSDLGEPDHVYLQEGNGSLLVLVWVEPVGRVDAGEIDLLRIDGDYLSSSPKGESPQVRAALYQLGPGVLVSKGDTSVVEETMVNGQPAVWVEGLHLLQIEGGHYALVRLVGDNVLVWTREENGLTVTYRLETSLPVEEAVRFAESLQ